MGCTCGKFRIREYNPLSHPLMTSRGNDHSGKCSGDLEKSSVLDPKGESRIREYPPPSPLEVYHDFMKKYGDNMKKYEGICGKYEVL